MLASPDMVAGQSVEVGSPGEGINACHLNHMNGNNGVRYVG